MLLKTPVSTPWASPQLTQRLLGPVSLLLGFTVGAAFVLWVLPGTFPLSPRLPAVLVGAMVAALSGLSVQRLALRQAARSRERRLADEATLELKQMRQSDTDLRTSVARHQAMLESLSGGFVILDRFDRYIHVSPGAARVLGRRGLRLGHRIYDDLDEPQAPLFYAAFAQAKATGLPQEVDFRCVQSGHFLAARIQPTAHNVTLFFRDITEQRFTLERVQAAEESFRMFTENVQDVFWVVDVPERRPVYASPSWERLTGLSVEALHHNPHAALDLVHRDDRARVCEHLLRCGADAERQRCEIEFRIVRPNGEMRWIHQRSVALHDELGRVTRLSGFASDITERKHMEASLRSSELRFRSLWESSPVGIFRTDMQMRIFDVNKGLLEICELVEAREQIEDASRSLIDLIHPEDRERVLEAWHRVEREGAWECRLANGKRLRTVLMRVACDLGPDGEQVGYTGTLSDLTEYREVQNRLAMSERMASLGTLAAGVGHEINNPLTYLMCNLELAQSTLHTLDFEADGARPGTRAQNHEGRERALNLLRIAFEGSCRIRDIVQELRIFGRSDSEQVGVVDSVHCLETALSIALHQVRHRAHIVRDLAPVPQVRADETRLGQVFLNLIVNAAQSIPEGRAHQNRLTLSSRFEPESQRVIFSISDTGSGIAPELLGRIFDPFFTTKDVGEGSGLGLFLSQQTLRSYGGSIEVESEPGRGSTFRVVLCPANVSALAAQVEGHTSPRALASGSHASPRALTPAPDVQQRARVLVIDDEAEVAKAIAAMLSTEHDVCVAELASDALEALETSPYDLILCDLMMPTMSASEFFQALTTRFPAHAERVYFMTGGAFTDHTRAFLEGAARPLLHKPFSLESLRGAVRTALCAREVVAD